MSQYRAAAIAIVVAFLVCIIATDWGFDTIRKDCPSGAAPKVSHNRPVRMYESQAGVFVIAVVAALLVGAVASGSGLDTIRKACPSGAAPKVSHNRRVRMYESHLGNGTAIFLGHYVRFVAERAAVRWRPRAPTLERVRPRTYGFSHTRVSRGSLPGSPSLT